MNAFDVLVSRLDITEEEINEHRKIHYSNFQN
jgi:hypothetical protein